MRAISSAPTPLSESAFTKAFFTASTSAWEMDLALEPRRWTWWLILPSSVSLSSLTSPALYLPEEMLWNCCNETLTRERSTGMAASLGKGKTV